MTPDEIRYHTVVKYGRAYPGSTAECRGCGAARMLHKGPDRLWCPTFAEKQAILKATETEQPF